MYHAKRISILLVVSFCLAAQGQSYRIEVVAKGLVQPWSLAFLPGGDMLITELPGRLRRVTADGTLGKPIEGVPDTYARSQGGFFDVLLHPGFRENRLIYLSYAEGPRKDNTLAIGRGRLDGDALRDFEVIFRVSPRKDTPVHYGGRMVWLADGTLLATTGDGFDEREFAQDPGNQMGKTVRMTETGEVPPDNPFVGRDGFDDYVYTYGHRNPQGLVYDEANDRIFMHEHGPRGGDELNLLVAGRNYGWPAITHGVDYSGAQISPFTEAPGMEQPLLHWTPSIAPSGMALYTGDVFPAWRGNLFVGALVARDVRRIELKDDAVKSESEVFEEIGDRIRDLRVGPDGLLYILTGERKGRLLKVVPGD